jgi:hypothetical protein
VSFDAITLCVASQRVFIVLSVYFVIDSVRKIFEYTLVQILSRHGKEMPTSGVDPRKVLPSQDTCNSFLQNSRVYRIYMSMLNTGTA